ncbi:MAG: hypothetical protein LRY55_02810, partial [Leadbetterella sp.]|nr:hypothetical protein [Leadbetterella sp.]
SVKRHKLIVMRLDIEELEEKPTDKIPGFRPDEDAGSADPALRGGRSYGRNGIYSHPQHSGLEKASAARPA